LKVFSYYDSTIVKMTIIDNNTRYIWIVSSFDTINS